MVLVPLIEGIRNLYLRSIVRQRHCATENIAERNQCRACTWKRADDMVAEQKDGLNDKECPQYADSSRPILVMLGMHSSATVGDIEMGWERFLRGIAFRGGGRARSFDLTAGHLGLGIEFGLDLVDLGFEAEF